MDSSPCPLSSHVALLYGVTNPPFIRSNRFCDSETAVLNGIQGWSLPSLIWSSVWYNSFCLFFLKYCNRRAQMHNSAAGQWLKDLHASSPTKLWSSIAIIFTLSHLQKVVLTRMNNWPHKVSMVRPPFHSIARVQSFNLQFSGIRQAFIHRSNYCELPQSSSSPYFEQA